MEKPTKVIDADYRVVGERAPRQPFWGPGANVSNVLCSLFSGAGFIAPAPEYAHLKPKWRSRIAYWLILALIIIGKLSS